MPRAVPWAAPHDENPHEPHCRPGPAGNRPPRLRRSRTAAAQRRDAVATGGDAGIPALPGQVFTAPAPSQAVRDQAALAAGCRADADRIVTTRDRGQLMREDERDARVGTDASIYARRGETDRLGRIYERDRIAEDCVQQNTQTPPRR
ncbi:hypothetical protein ACFQY5_02145 [Paeniroseomonas aquatica]|uniref:hypothetical protein n=1 Tax=Paeniroseomonas aquatica TaxID=373043 RepID=UPI00360DC9A1